MVPTHAGEMMIRFMRITALMALGLLLAACSSSGISKPGTPGGSQTGGLPGGGAGSPFPVPSGQSGKSGTPGESGPPGGTPKLPGGESGSDMPGMGKTGSGDSEDLEEVFEKSLGDFDGEMEQERAAMEQSGEGSTGAAEQREGADASTVGDASMKTGGASGGMASIPSAEQSGDQAGDSSDPNSSDDSSDAGAGQEDVSYEGKGGDVDSSERDAARVAKIPDDIPVDGSTDDQVAEQIRQAAMAEEDPLIRDALWEEYRKHTGIKQ